MAVKFFYWCLSISLLQAGLLQAGIDQSQLFEHIRRGIVTVAWLDAHGVDSQQLNVCMAPGSDTPLGVAIQARFLHTVRALLDAGADINASSNGLLPIELATQRSNTAIVKQLLLSGASITPLMCQFAPQNNDLFHFLIHLFKPFYLINARDGDNPYRLTSALVHDCVNRMLLYAQDEHKLMDLIKLGADVSYRDEQGWSALDHALARCQWRLVTILRSQGAQPTTPQVVQRAQEGLYNDTHCLKSDDCPRALRAVHGEFTRAGLYEQFVQHVQHDTLTEDFLRCYFTGINKLSINRPFAEHQYLDALSLAVQADHYRAAQLLVRFGARVHRDVLAYALDHCSKKMIRLLLEHGARLHWVARPLERIIEYNPNARELVPWLAPQTMRIARNQALRFAQRHGLIEIAELLKKAQACGGRPLKI